jgi:uncharacterized protein YjdB
VTVTPPAVASLTLAPATSNLNVGGQLQLTPTLRDKRNNVLTGRTVSYSSSNVSIATVSASGLVRGVSAGTVTITATSEGKTATSQLTVIRVLGVSIDGIFIGGTQTPANGASITGAIDIGVTYTLIAGATATKLELLLEIAREAKARI